jgi:signal transduction histidine kinase
MIEIVGCIVDGHDLWLVVLAGVVCTLASNTCFSMLYRAGHQDGRQRLFWTGAAALAMGFGVWSTHFIAMLAYSTPWPVGYDEFLTALSAVIAVSISGLGLWLVLRGAYALGGAICGAGIGAMHFTGMAAVEGEFLLEWNLNYVVASLVVGVVLSTLAFTLLPRVKGTRGRLLVATVFVLAICGLHFTAMTAVTMTYDPFSATSGATALQRQSLAIGVAAVAALLLCVGLLGAFFDGYLADRNAREAERLRRYVAELEATQADLRATTQNLGIALEAAAASSQAKSQFLATMSHELRTPLNAIIGFSQLLQSEPLGPLGNERYREYAGDILDSGTHLLSLINDVLDFSKADAGRLDLQEEELDARHILNECLRLVAPEAQEADIAVVTEMQETAPTLLADRRRVKQIALNLLSNALKFTPSGGTLRVKLACDAEGLEISVADNGIGMSPEQIPIALEPFGQVDSRLSRQHEGTGLGLPLCRRFAEAHGGSLTIASALGEGTTVTVRFPLERVKSSRAA